MRKELKFIIESVDRHLLPNLYKVSGTVDGGGQLIFEFHEDLGLKYTKGEKLKLILSDEKIPPARDDDYCGRSFLYKIVENRGEKVYLFSMGGYIFRLSTPLSLDEVKIAEFYYICVSKS